MKIKCTQENFKRAIFNTERVIGKQLTLPILENVLLKTEKGMLNISATNLELGVSVKIRAKIEKEGEITVPVKLLSSFLNNLPNEDIISLEVENDILRIENGKSKTNIKGLSTNEFPIIPKKEGEFLFKFNSQELKKVISNVVFAVSIDNTRPEISGVNLIFGEKDVTFAATDSFRLSEAILKINQINEYGDFIKNNNSFIVPVSALIELSRVIAGDEVDVLVFIEDNQIFFQIDGTQIVSRLINGKYPEYKQIIPTKFQTKVILNKEDVVRGIKISSLFTNIKSGEVNMNILTEKVFISANSEDKGENESEINGEINGKEQDLVFNPKYILDGLNALNSKKIIFLISENFSPVVLRMYDDNKNEIIENFTYVIMPIRK